MHIFLTGEVRIGKSTVLEKILAELGDVRLGGFRTVKVADRTDAYGSVYLVPAAEKSPQCTDENRVAIRRGSGQGTEGFTAVFDAAGTAALCCAEECVLILMDEIGKLERDAAQFGDRICQLLDGDVPILGVVRKEGETPLQHRVRTHPKVRVIEVTKQNRDTLAEEIIQLLRPQLSA